MAKSLPDSQVVSSREKILDVAEALFARRGYAGISMNDVSVPVGLSKSSLFHHFSGKLEIYAEVCERVLGRISERVRPALEGPGDPPGRLDAAVGALCDALSDHPDSARLLLRAMVEDELFSKNRRDLLEASDRALADLVSVLTNLIQEGVAARKFRDVSVPDVVQTLIGAVVLHFASGETGELILGEAIFSSAAVARRRREVIAFIHCALVRSSDSRTPSIEGECFS